MHISPRTLPLERARRIALTAQGLTGPRPPAATRRDVRHLRRVLDTVDIVQIDSVNVLTRAHELPFFSRLGAHDRAARDRWLWQGREAYEGWTHVASVTAMEVWPLMHHRRAAHRAGGRMQRALAADPALTDRVLAEVAERGPTSVRDLTNPGERTGPWWGSPAGKVALEHLALSGELVISHRTSNFVTVYDLPERVIPAHILGAEVPDLETARRMLLLRAARTHGIGTAADLADHHRLSIRPARATLARLAAEGLLEEVRVAEWGTEPVYLHPEARAARRPAARTLLSPFDPMVWFRDRVHRLFDFHYRIEIYVPEADRRHGYYVLPFLLGDTLVARVDLKADRKGGRLEVRGAFAEPDVDRVHVAHALSEELQELAAWLGLQDVVVGSRGDLTAPLTDAL